MNYLKELFSEWLGFRKLGAIDEPDDRDYDTKVIASGQKEKGTVLRNTHVLNQFRTNRCTAYALAGVIATMLTRRLDKEIFVDPVHLWINQKQRRAVLAQRDSREKWDMEKKGDTLQNAIHSLIDFGVVFNDYDVVTGKPNFRNVTFQGYAKTRDAKEMIDWIKQGHPIYTGSGVYDDYVDTQGYWRTKGRRRKGGHAFFIPNTKQFFELQNSWGDLWADRGMAKVRKGDAKGLYSTYVLYGMEIH